MKILLPNAKELNTNLESFPFQSLSSQSQKILAVLSQMTLEELMKFYQLKEEKAELEMDRWQRVAKGQAKLYPAWQLYDGLMYRYMNRKDLSKKEEDYWSEHVYIATGFYGLIGVFDKISPHRLDFQGQLKIGERSLKQFWREQYDGVVEGDELLISLLSSEFESVFSPEIQKRMTKMIFMEDKEGQLKVHSTISKKGRGRLVSEMARKNIQDIESLKQLQVDGFIFRKDLSSEKELVFVRTV